VSSILICYRWKWNLYCRSRYSAMGFPWLCYIIPTIIVFCLSA